MWRATLEILDFLPLSIVDYSGGIISTDWYNEGAATNESIKISVRFLTNQIRADGIKIIIHKKKCNPQQECTVKKITSALENELQVAILKKAVVFEKQTKKKNRKKRPDLK
jgi:CelD/BcsL family acetyltransferase involved in cellulose biosynthesis